MMILTYQIHCSVHIHLEIENLNIPDKDVHAYFRKRSLDKMLNNTAVSLVIDS